MKRYLALSIFMLAMPCFAEFSKAQIHTKHEKIKLLARCNAAYYTLGFRGDSMPLWKKAQEIALSFQDNEDVYFAGIFFGEEYEHYESMMSRLRHEGDGKDKLKALEIIDQNGCEALK